MSSFKVLAGIVSVIGGFIWLIITFLYQVGINVNNYKNNEEDVQDGLKYVEQFLKPEIRVDTVIKYKISIDTVERHHHRVDTFEKVIIKHDTTIIHDTAFVVRPEEQSRLDSLAEVHMQENLADFCFYFVRDVHREEKELEAVLLQYALFKSFWSSLDPAEIIAWVNCIQAEKNSLFQLYPLEPDCMLDSIRIYDPENLASLLVERIYISRYQPNSSKYNKDDLDRRINLAYRKQRMSTSGLRELSAAIQKIDKWQKDNLLLNEANCF